MELDEQVIQAAGRHQRRRAIEGQRGGPEGAEHQRPEVPGDQVDPIDLGGQGHQRKQVLDRLAERLQPLRTRDLLGGHL